MFGRPRSSNGPEEEQQLTNKSSSEGNTDKAEEKQAHKQGDAGVALTEAGQVLHRFHALFGGIDIGNDSEGTDCHRAIGNQIEQNSIYSARDQFPVGDELLVQV